MTSTTPQSNDSTANATLQQHHQHAGEHLQQAATNHLAAAKMHGTGDTKAAQHHAQVASDHTAHARQYMSQAEKLVAPESANQTAKTK